MVLLVGLLLHGWTSLQSTNYDCPPLLPLWRHRKCLPLLIYKVPLHSFIVWESPVCTWICCHPRSTQILLIPPPPPPFLLLFHQTPLLPSAPISSSQFSPPMSEGLDYLTPLGSVGRMVIWTSSQFDVLTQSFLYNICVRLAWLGALDPPRPYS